MRERQIEERIYLQLLNLVNYRLGFAYDAVRGGALLMRARQGWRNLIVTSFEVRQIETLRNQLRAEFDQRHASPVTSASRSRIHSTQGT